MFYKKKQFNFEKRAKVLKNKFTFTIVHLHSITTSVIVIFLSTKNLQRAPTDLINAPLNDQWVQTVSNKGNNLF